ncbi:anti-sigma-D factor RsdA [Pseudonocardia sp. H11422]|uniref:anti-sigma-D factor RsdA n=1 Tax=Pseudonocardia sp. H11422 TaxID=2835866 RepID=UPI001BDBB86F|nr:anti-sigma-D factor RsdA [Pseudonocardia sp. H11422]
MRDRNRRGSDGNPFGSSDGHLPNPDHPNGANGVHPPGMRPRPVPIDEPVDLVAVQADDELINALAAGMAVSAPGLDGYDDDDRVAAMLAAWKAEVDAEPIPDLIDTDTAVAAIASTGRTRGRRARHLIPLAGAAALIVFAFAGVSVGAHSAHPGDTLWGVSKVLYSERAESVEAAATVQVKLEKVRTALAAGKTAEAAVELAEAKPLLTSVRPEEGAPQLSEQQEFLAAKLSETPAGTPTDPKAPLRSGTPAPESTPPGTPPGSTSPESSSPPGTEPSTVPQTSDPRVLIGPGSTTTTPSPAPESTTPVETKPTTEGVQDPTTTPGQSMDAPTGGTAGANATASAGHGTGTAGTPTS